MAASQGINVALLQTDAMDQDDHPDVKIWPDYLNPLYQNYWKQNSKAPFHFIGSLPLLHFFCFVPPGKCSFDEQQHLFSSSDVKHQLLLCSSGE